MALLFSPLKQSTTCSHIALKEAATSPMRPRDVDADTDAAPSLRSRLALLWAAVACYKGADAECRPRRKMTAAYDQVEEEEEEWQALRAQIARLEQQLVAQEQAAQARAAKQMHAQMEVSKLLEQKTQEVDMLEMMLEEFKQSSSEIEASLEDEIERLEARVVTVERALHTATLAKDKSDAQCDVLNSELNIALERLEYVTAELQASRRSVQALEQDNDDLETLLRISKATVQDLERKIEASNEMAESSTRSDLEKANTESQSVDDSDEGDDDVDVEVDSVQDSSGKSLGSIAEEDDEALEASILQLYGADNYDANDDDEYAPIA